jgi:membrane protein implicated in regulation of membrane protease activity
MSPETITWVWFIAGIALIAAELFMPGLVVSFLGLAAMIIAGLRWLGLFQGIIESFTAWFVISIILLITVRQLALKWLPSERTFQMTDEDVEAIGTVVDVVNSISTTGTDGRIRFGGTTWPAVSKEGIIPAGAKAKLIYRDNVMWVVEPYLELEEPKKE